MIIDAVALLVFLCGYTESVVLNCSPINVSCPGNKWNCRCQAFGSLTWHIDHSDGMHSNYQRTYLAYYCRERRDAKLAGIEVILCTAEMGRNHFSLTSTFNVTAMSTFSVTCRNVSTTETLNLRPPSK